MSDKAENAVYNVIYSTLKYLDDKIKAATGPAGGFVKSVNNVTPNAEGNVSLTIPSEVTQNTVETWGFTKNEGTVTSVNNVLPINGNVILSIPDAVTETDIIGMGFTKNIGTYIKPTDGIPESDLAETIKAKLNSPHITEADVASWGFTKNTGTLTGEEDPVFMASPAHDITAEHIEKWNAAAAKSENDPIFADSAASDITAQDIENWNAKTSNVGTVTSVNNVTPVNGNVTLTLPTGLPDTDPSTMPDGWLLGHVPFTVAIDEEQTPYWTPLLAADILMTSSGTADDMPPTLGKYLSTLYQKPESGIPAADLAEAVQTSLGLANTALQSEQFKGTVTSVNGSTPDANGAVTIEIPSSLPTITQSSVTQVLRVDKDTDEAYWYGLGTDDIMVSSENLTTYLNGISNSYVPKSGARGTLAGYATPTVPEGNSITVDKSSGDDIAINGSGKTVSVPNGSAGETWLKTLAVADASTTFNFGDAWLLPNDEIPALGSNCVVALYWTGTYGVVSVTYGSEDGTGSGSALKIPEVTGKGGQFLTNNGTSLVWTSALTSETDPIFVASPAHGITSEMISTWNSALQEEQFRGTVTSVNNVTPVNGNVTIEIPDALPAQADNAGKYLTTDGSAASWASIDLSDYIAKSGSRGALAGYSTPTTNAEATISIDKSSPDDLVVSNAAPTISIANGAAGESWLKVVSIAHAEATLTFGDQWLLPNDEIPALADNCVMSLYWNGTYGVVSMTYGTEDGSGAGSALKIPEVSGQTDKILSNNGTSLVWKDAPVPATATTDAAGIVKPDGTTITVADGVISASVLPEMSSDTSGKFLANNGENTYWTDVLDENTADKKYIKMVGERCYPQYGEGHIGGFENAPILYDGTLYGGFSYGEGSYEIEEYVDGWRVFDDDGNFIVDKMTPDCVGVYDGNIVIGDNWNSDYGPWAAAEGSSGGPRRFDSWMKVLYLFNPGTITVLQPAWWTIDGDLTPLPHDQLVVFWNAGSGIIKLIHKE